MNEETIYEGTAQNKVNPNAAQNVNNDESTILETAARLKNGETKVAPEGKEKTSKGNKKSDNAWINVTLGGVSGILLGAGLMYGANAFSQGKEPDGETVEPDNGGSSTPPVEPQLTEYSYGKEVYIAPIRQSNRMLCHISSRMKLSLRYP